MVPMLSSWVESELRSVQLYQYWDSEKSPIEKKCPWIPSSDGLRKSATTLEEETGKKCLPAQADVRKPDDLKRAVKAAIETYGRIDYVVCGESGQGRKNHE